MCFLDAQRFKLSARTGVLGSRVISLGSGCGAMRSCQDPFGSLTLTGFRERPPGGEGGPAIQFTGEISKLPTGG